MQDGGPRQPPGPSFCFWGRAGVGSGCRSAGGSKATGGKQGDGVAGGGRRGAGRATGGARGDRGGRATGWPGGRRCERVAGAGEREVRGGPETGWGEAGDRRRRVQPEGESAGKRVGAVQVRWGRRGSQSGGEPPVALRRGLLDGIMTPSGPAPPGLRSPHPLRPEGTPAPRGGGRRFGRPCG